MRLKAVTVSIVLAATAYLCTVLWAGRAGVMAAIGGVGMGTLAIVLGLSLTNYAVRFVRWRYYLHKLGYALPVTPDLLIYIGGFALTTTPGKAGELARSLWLRPYGVLPNRSIAAFFAERLQDFVAVLLLSSLGLSLYPGGRWLLLAALGLLVLALAVIYIPGGGYAMTRWSGKSRVGAIILRLTPILAHARDCLAPIPLLVGLVAGIAAWSAESWGFAIVLGALGHPLPLPTAFSIYAFSMLAGAVSFLPGGLGGSEAAMILLLRLAGVPVGIAVSGTLLIRLATLWFAVLLGIIALSIRTQRAPSDASASTPAGVTEAAQ
jgi:uncharacterized membrane protein YbhN (UPF0104 family)